MQIAWAGRAGIDSCILAAAFCTGCAGVNPRPDFERVDRHVADAVGIGRYERPDDAATLQELVNKRLEGGLSADEAVQICLLNNPRLSAAIKRVGIARADLVQAGLFQNPSLSLSLRLPDGGGLGNLELAIAQNIADLWLIPIRTKAAEGELERSILDLAREMSVAALDVRAAYVNAVGLERGRELAEENRGVTQKLLDAAQARQQAGTGSALDVNLARAEYMQSEVALREAALAAYNARRALAVLLGLMTPPEELVLTDKLTDPPRWSIEAGQLVDSAMTHRLDLRAASHVVEAAAARVTAEKASVVSEVEAGASFERASRGRRGDRTWAADAAWATAEAGALTAPSLRPREKQPTDTILGPTLALKLPVFDQNQAQIARAELLYEQALLQREAMTVEATQEVRGAYQRAQAAWEAADYYRNSFLPHLENNLALSREAYTAGKLSLLAVLEAQKLLLASRGKYVESLRNAAVAQTELEKAIGAPIAKIAGSSSPASPPTTQEVQP